MSDKNDHSEPKLDRVTLARLRRQYGIDLQSYKKSEPAYIKDELKAELPEPALQSEDFQEIDSQQDVNSHPSSNSIPVVETNQINIENSNSRSNAEFPTSEVDITYDKKLMKQQILLELQHRLDSLVSGQASPDELVRSLKVFLLADLSDKEVAPFLNIFFAYAELSLRLEWGGYLIEQRPSLFANLHKGIRDLILINLCNSNYFDRFAESYLELFYPYEKDAEFYKIGLFDSPTVVDHYIAINALFALKKYAEAFHLLKIYEKEIQIRLDQTPKLCDESQFLLLEGRIAILAGRFQFARSRLEQISPLKPEYRSSKQLLESIDRMHQRPDTGDFIENFRKLSATEKFKWLSDKLKDLPMLSQEERYQLKEIVLKIDLFFPNDIVTLSKISNLVLQTLRYHGCDFGFVGSWFEKKAVEHYPRPNRLAIWEPVRNFTSEFQSSIDSRFYLNRLPEVFNPLMYWCALGHFQCFLAGGISSNSDLGAFITIFNSFGFNSDLERYVEYGVHYLEFECDLMTIEKSKMKTLLLLYSRNSIKLTRDEIAELVIAEDIRTLLHLERLKQIIEDSFDTSLLKMVLLKIQKLRTLTNSELLNLSHILLQEDRRDQFWIVCSMRVFRENLPCSLKRHWKLSGEVASFPVFYFEEFKNVSAIIVRSISFLKGVKSYFSLSSELTNLVAKDIDQLKVVKCRKFIQGLPLAMRSPLLKGALNFDGRSVHFCSLIESSEMEKRLLPVVHIEQKTSWDELYSALYHLYSGLLFYHTSVFEVLREFVTKTKKELSESKEGPKSAGVKWYLRLNEASKFEFQKFSSFIKKNQSHVIFEDFQVFIALMTTIICPDHLSCLNFARNFKENYKYKQVIEKFLLSDSYLAYRRKKGIDSRMGITKNELV